MYVISYEEGIEPASAYGLTLTKVDYPHPIEWIEDGYTIRRAHEHIYEHLIRHRVMAEVLENLVPQN